MSGRVVILRGDAAHLPLPDASVDLIVTSPPYFGLRSYTDSGEHYAGQIGSEATPREFLEALWACTREWIRVLKPEGSLFVNLGDKYSERGGPGHSAGVAGRLASRPERPRRKGYAETGVPPKSLMLLPQRYAIGCVDDLGLILRAEIVWSKPNGLPESVTDRVKRAHEQVFHFTKRERYFAAVDEIRIPTADVGRKPKAVRSGLLTGAHGSTGHDGNGMRMAEVYNNPLGALPGSVWDIPSAPLVVPSELGIDHFAAYPPELVRRIVLGWSPSGICTACGQGRRPVPVAEAAPAHSWALAQRAGRSWKPGDSRTLGARAHERNRHISGYACACPDASAPTRPALVADPFGGTGTTALVASVLGRTGISVDLSQDYGRIARWRTSDPGERARALGVPKPPRQVDGQGSLFDGMEAS